jgi:hypothetical protein
MVQPDWQAPFKQTLPPQQSEANWQPAPGGAQALQVPRSQMLEQHWAARVQGVSSARQAWQVLS